MWKKMTYLRNGGIVRLVNEDGGVVVDVGYADDDGNIAPLAAGSDRARHLPQVGAALIFQTILSCYNP